MAIKAKSTNPLIYNLAGEILRKKGRLEQAKKISQMGQALGQEAGIDKFPYPDYLRLKIF